jgi:hypothetical protein
MRGILEVSGSSHLQTREQHAGSAGVSVIDLCTQFVPEKPFLQSRLDPESDYDQHQTGEREWPRFQRRRRGSGDDNTGVNGMPNQAVRARVDDMVIRLARD